MRTGYYIIEDVAAKIYKAIEIWEIDFKDKGGALNPDKRFSMPLNLSGKVSIRINYMRILLQLK